MQSAAVLAVRFYPLPNTPRGYRSPPYPLGVLTRSLESDHAMHDEKTRKKLLTRLKRLEGQIGAIRRMVEEDRYCVDVLIQISAVQGALGKVGHLLLSQHIETCVRQAFEHGDEEARQTKIAELMDVFGRYAGIGK